MLTIEGLLCTLSLLYQPAIYKSLKTVLQKRLFQDYGRSGYEAFTDSVDFTQFKFSCCGVVSPSDFQNSLISSWRDAPHYQLSKLRLEVPKTCCKLLNKEVIPRLISRDILTSFFLHIKCDHQTSVLFRFHLSSEKKTIFQKLAKCLGGGQ